MNLTAVELSLAIANKRMSCLELMRDTLSCISAVNEDKNAIVSMAETDQLLAAARRADSALAKGEYWGWMHGIPHAVKDLADVKGFINSFGSPIFRDNLAQEDAIFVQRIRQQGAIFIGKTNVPEFGLGSHTYNNVFGATKNAFDSNLSAGGSSGGAAVALATGMVAVADGSDLMGSLRNPAAFNNVAGFRPSAGKIPSLNDNAVNDQLPSDGPMARTVTDLIALFTTMTRSEQSPIITPTQTHTIPKLTGTKIAWLADFDGYLPMQSGVTQLCERALRNLQSAGATVEPVSIPFAMDELWRCWLTLRHWIVFNGKRELYFDNGKRALCKPELIWEIEGGLNLTANDITYANKTRAHWSATLNTVFEKWDILALPAAQVFPFSADQHWPKSIAGRAMDTYHRWMEISIGATLSGCPVISLPAGFDGQEPGSRPMGIQFVAPVGQDEKLLQFALAFEEVNPWRHHYKF